MSNNEVRYKSIPATWPPNCTVFIDFANGLTKQYSTDAKGIPTFINQYQNEASGSTWGNITGTLSDQIDLQDALDNAGSGRGYFPGGW
jgi:hypothetical protein